MLKFLRKYQKWMLVVFCGALMVAFLVPQALDQFAPSLNNPLLGTLYDGQEVRRADVVRASADVQRLRDLRIEPLPMLSILPRTDSERDDGLAWIMIQEAAKRNGLDASRNEAFNLMLMAVGAENQEALERRAKELGGNSEYLIELGRQYLAAEQYRRLVSGVEYSLPADEDGIGSPGLRRVVAMSEAGLLVQQIAQNPQQLMQLAALQGTTPEQLLSRLLVEQGLFDEIQGHVRLSDVELRQALQRQLAELDLTVVVLDGADRVEATEVDDAYIQDIFERFADDAPGTGEPYGLGYLEDPKVKLEALRVPIDAVREMVAKTITAEDVRTFYNENRSTLIETPSATEVEGDDEAEVEAGPVKLTAALRDQIRLTLIQQRAQERVIEIAQQARQQLVEDGRGLESDGIYKVLPEGFEPTALGEVASEIELEHGIVPELVLVDRFVSGQAIADSARLTRSWLREMPTSTVKLPGRAGIEVDETVLGGQAGLFTATAMDPEFFGASLAQYVGIAKGLLDEQQREQVTVALQVGLPGAVMRDDTGSAYVFRLTEVRASRPAPELGPIAEQVREDAINVKAYESLVAEQPSLIKRAAEQSIESLMENADAKQTLTGLTRGMINQRFAARIEGVGSSAPILQRAFQLADDTLASGGFDQLSEEDRLFVVELPGDYKLAVVRLDTFRPITRQRYEEEAVKPASLLSAGNLGLNAASLPEPPMSFEALQRYTGFEWAEGEEPEDEDAEGESAEAA